MPDHTIARTPSAYDYQLLIKNLLLCPVVDAPDQEIVYRGSFRYTYRELHNRVKKLANALTSLGVKPGDTVAVMDWDSHRYLECFFAIPMLGAVLHTINVRLSPEQILYTIDHAEYDFLLVNSEFMPILEQIRGRMDTVKGFVLLNDEPSAPTTTIPFCGEYEELLEVSSPDFDFADFDENTRATTFYSTGTTVCRRGSISVTGSWCCTPWLRWGCSVPPPGKGVSTARMSTCRSLRCSTFTPGASPM